MVLLLKRYKPQKFGTLHRKCMVKSAGVPKLYTRQISHTFSMESTKILIKAHNFLAMFPIILIF